MWYLIVPPFIIVLSLGGILWFLSLRMNEADIAEKLSELRDSSHGDVRSRSLVRRALLLKFLETVASKSKTGSLRIHNFFQRSLEHLRRKRTEVDAMRKTIGAKRETEESEKKTDTGEKVAEKPSEVADEQSGQKAPPAVSGYDGEKTVEKRRPVPEFFERPVLRDAVTRPDGTTERPGASSPTRSKEEVLIARIVENPKDAVAYEELGDCYFATGNLQDAKECYRQTLKLHPTNRAVKVKVRRLERVFEERMG